MGMVLVLKKHLRLRLVITISCRTPLRHFFIFTYIYNNTSNLQKHDYITTTENRFCFLP